MFTLISMIRGINVGGARTVRMSELRETLEAMGFSRVRTYLQSGNAVFDARGGDAGRHAGSIERGMLDRHGLEVSVAVTTPAAMATVVAANPFLGRPGVDPRFLHATFLIGARRLSLDGIGLPLASGEAAELAGDVVYLYCPLGYGCTKVNNTYFERKLAARATTRNWRTVEALDRMGRGEPA